MDKYYSFRFKLDFKLDAHFKKTHSLRKVDVHQLIALNDQNMWNKIDLGNINKIYVEWN